ncbi:MAG: UbiA family prenyltransferase [Sphingobium sp.]|jgi:4-hydroxybenzoate polyprenyltransferase|nr:UbiA family prenyltransferase [Sphingobium sp.]MCI1270938.1 UbiA family prenyltransferase [Sphingobium sp.]MCI1757305.1 UbiA family prenyltransferase [Sphingobium sp.]MCI2053523.1 UbiA family prenyltransferase [Sphingobium sp.]
MTTAPLPLVVDLDDTLVRTDTLVESAVLLATRAPRKFAAQLPHLFDGRAAFKSALADAAKLDCTTLPYNKDIIAFLEKRKAAGGAVWLVTAADARIAHGVADHLKLFNGVIASDSAHNLKGKNKAAALAERFPQGFDYIGDAPADIAVWEKASSAYVAGCSSAASRALKARGITPAQRFAPLPMRARDWVKALRLHQWSKNLMLFVPLILGQAFRDPATVLAVLAGFLCFGLVASATYLFNDMNDLAADRGHFGKRHRAIASGKLPLMKGVAIGAAMLIAGVAGAALLNPAFLLVLLCYLALTISYSLWLKTQPLLDVMVIGGLFTLRVQAGVALANQPQSLWLTSFALILFSSLALAKRHAELIRAIADNRPVVGRGYLASDTPLTVSLGIALAAMSVIVMLFYMQFDVAGKALYFHPRRLFFVPLVLGSWLIRIWVKAHRGELHDDPVVFALKDDVSILHGGAVALCWLAATS